MGEAKRRKTAGDYPPATAKPPRPPPKPPMPSESVTWDVIEPLERHPKAAAVVALLPDLREEHAGEG